MKIKILIYETKITFFIKNRFSVYYIKCDIIWQVFLFGWFGFSRKGFSITVLAILKLAM